MFEEDLSKPTEKKPDIDWALTNFQHKKEAEKIKENNVSRPNAISLTNDIKITGGANIKKWLQPAERNFEEIIEEVKKSNKELFYIFEDNTITDHSIKDNYHTMGGGSEDGITWYLPTSRSEGLTFKS